MKHASHDMHANSLATYREEEANLSARAFAIAGWIRIHGDATDREIAYGMGFGENLNAVRPRITEMIDAAVLIEVRTTRCHVTGKPVRVVGLPRKQGDLFQ